MLCVNLERKIVAVSYLFVFWKAKIARHLGYSTNLDEFFFIDLNKTSAKLSCNLQDSSDCSSLLVWFLSGIQTFHGFIRSFLGFFAAI